MYGAVVKADGIDDGGGQGTSRPNGSRKAGTQKTSRPKQDSEQQRAPRRTSGTPATAPMGQHRSQDDTAKPPPATAYAPQSAAERHARSGTGDETKTVNHFPSNEHSGPRKFGLPTLTGVAQTELAGAPA